ncbi:WhiB family transcriptional regulator [Streptomyces sp. NBC_00377]|uniref:WhiB family transcriptional regulator n=1 Tax=unclassified Streptomyces TaxID=2593676 RepID=UPI002E20E9DE|nr:MULTISPECIES: WhiB family transcriptional regulator [unclassified Streptomyces]
MEWLRAAACVGEDPELFFPVGTTGPALREATAAKRVCARCPVRGECLSYALGTAQTSGVWGGTGEEERTELLRTARYEATRRSLARTELGRIEPFPMASAGQLA